MGFGFVSALILENFDSALFFYVQNEPTLGRRILVGVAEEGG